MTLFYERADRGIGGVRPVAPPPRPGPLFEGNPVGEGTTRRGTATPVLVGFLQLRRQYQISHEVQRGAQRASRVVLGTSGLRACGEGDQAPLSMGILQEKTQE